MDDASRGLSESGGYVRREDAPILPPPPGQTGVLGWLWRNLFSSMSNFSTPGAAASSILTMLLTVVVGYFGISQLWALIDFALISARWTDVGPDGLNYQGAACRTVSQTNGLMPDGWFGACWPFVGANWQFFVYGFYPDQEIWRVNIVFLVGALGTAWLVSNAVPSRRIVGLVIAILGVGYGALVTSLFGEPFGVRVGVQILLGVGLMYMIMPEDAPRRGVALAMLVLYPLLAFVLLTGADLEATVGSLATTALFAGVLLLAGFAAKRGALGPIGAVFGGVMRGVGWLAAGWFVASLVTSSVVVSAYEAATGYGTDDRDRAAFEWWLERNPDGDAVPRPDQREDFFAEAGLETWIDAEPGTIVGNERDSFIVRMENLRWRAPGLTETESAALDWWEGARPEGGAEPLPSDLEAFAAQNGGVALTAWERQRLNRLDWEAPLFGVTTVASMRSAWPLPTVPTEMWGGLLVTLVVAISGIVFSLPLGVLLALGRRSSLPAVRLVSIVFIEFWRGVPLITVLFMSSVMLPFFLPEGVDFNKLLRALIGVMLFSAAYQAEVVRGGLQAIPKGQFEGAQALGLSYWPMMQLIVLPQALTLVIPGIVNTFIGLFKDTTLVLVISLFDLLLTVQNAISRPEWISPSQAPTGYLLATLIFFLFCFGMSRYSMFIERSLRRGHNR